jgi:hypothetical protein
MNLINTNFPRTRVTERNGRYIYAVTENGATAQIATTATPEQLAEVGLYERVDTPPTYDPDTQRITATGNWPEGMREYEVVALNLDEVKQRRKSKIDGDFEALVEQGFDTGLGFSLRLQDRDRTAFSQRKQLLDTAVALGQAQETDTSMIADTDGNRHEVDYGQLTTILLQYGFYYDVIWNRRTAARESINNATTIQEVLGVEL